MIVHVPLGDLVIDFDACIERVNEGEPVPDLDTRGVTLYVGEPVLVFDELVLPVLVWDLITVVEGLLDEVVDGVYMNDSVIKGEDDDVFESADDSEGTIVGSILIVMRAVDVLAKLFTEVMVLWDVRVDVFEDVADKVGTRYILSNLLKSDDVLYNRVLLMAVIEDNIKNRTPISNFTI